MSKTPLLDLKASFIALLPVHDAELLECILKKNAEDATVVVVCRIHSDEAAEFARITGIITAEFQITLHCCCLIEATVVGYTATSESLDSWSAIGNAPHPVTQVPTPSIVRHEFRFSGGTHLFALTANVTLEPWQRTG
jgi:hypothetical protein